MIAVQGTGFVWKSTVDKTRQGRTTHDKKESDQRTWKTREHKTTPDEARHNNITWDANP